MKWAFSLCGVLAFLCGTASAQGLIRNLPKDGTWVKYEGTVTQETKRPDSNEGDLKLEWRRTLTIKSVGTEQAEYRGQTVPARWLELSVETGLAKEGVLEAGPGGVQVYKILVPESAVTGENFEVVVGERKAFISHLPVIKGLRKSGDAAVEEVTAGVFQLYPFVSLMQHYPEKTVSESTEQVTFQAGSFQAGSLSLKVEKGSRVTETAMTRVTTNSEVSLAPQLPFGVFKWTSTTVTEQKGSTDLRSDFQPATTVTEVMLATATGDGAESVLAK